MFCFRQGNSFKTLPNDNLTEKGCEKNQKLAFITHGWREDRNSGWVKDMVENLTEVRDGCIVFIDYSYYGVNPNYFLFLFNFDSISKAVTAKLNELESQGFDPDKWFMFGHSAGARLVIDAAANFGYQKVKEIDGKAFDTFCQHLFKLNFFSACDLAGPAFDFRTSTKNPQKAAKNVACIHTSALVGSIQRICHQDWMMGNCGRDQPAADFWKWAYCSASPNCDSSLHESHGLCPHFYNSAFKNDFVADNSLYKCGSQRKPKQVIDGFKMGYMESRKS